MLNENELKWYEATMNTLRCGMLKWQLIKLFGKVVKCEVELGTVTGYEYRGKLYFKECDYHD